MKLEIKEEFIELRKKFNEIKKRGLIKPLRKGSTGVGYTFEKLLGKEEDSLSLPDYNGIELKTKLGYSKSAMTLFNCIPIKGNETAINYILDKYAWKRQDIKYFSLTAYCNNSSKRGSYFFKLNIDYLGKQIILQSYKDNSFYENLCVWNFKDLETKLWKKLKYLALITAYPYRIKGVLYYKYLKMRTYKLKGFFEFLHLLSEDKIHIHFYLKRLPNGTIENHGIAFKIDNNYIPSLFSKLFY